MKNPIPVLLLVFFCFTMTAFSQQKHKTKTDVNKDVDIVKVYEQVIKEGYGTPFIYKKLANTEYFNSNYAEAKKWFEKLFETEKTIDETLRVRYKQTLKALNLPVKSNPYVLVSTNKSR